MTNTPNAAAVSYEFIRQVLASTNKYELEKAKYGILYATQDIRALGRLHTYYSGQRAELDYVHAGTWLYPNVNWPEPLFVNLGLGVHHCSGCIKGYTLSVAPSASDAIRLYRNCVLPKELWLTQRLRRYAQDWDVFGLDDWIAIDNALDLIAGNVILMWIALGVIVLRLPPNRGDLKGKNERTNQTVQRQHLSRLPGYVPPPSRKGFDKRYEYAREAAKAKANLTFADFEDKLVSYICEFNHAGHPDLHKPRIQIFRERQEIAPLIVPTGALQLRATFALTYRAKLTREGVQVENVHFNSDELHAAFRTYSGNVFVKLNPDNVQSVLVILPGQNEPLEAQMKTFELREPVTLEMFKLARARAEQRNPAFDPNTLLPVAFAEELENITRWQHVPGERASAAAQAAAHGAVTAEPESDQRLAPPRSNQSAEHLLRGSRINS